jgi:transcriptional regulator with XRE-family HTH domain
LPLYQVRLSAKMPLSDAYPKTLKTIGHHLRKRRLDLKLYQKDVAKIVGIDTNSITNWEKNRTSPRLYLLPRIINFLGYDPVQSNATTLGEKIKKHRIQKGLSLRKLAKALGIDPGTLARWENGNLIPSAKVNNRIRGFINVLL